MKELSLNDEIYKLRHPIRDYIWNEIPDHIQEEISIIIWEGVERFVYSEVGGQVEDMLRMKFKNRI